MARSLIASDDFNRSDAPVGANWITTDYYDGTSAPKIVSNQVTAKDANISQAMVWIGTGTFTNPQYSKATIAGLGNFGATTYVGVSVREGDVNGGNRAYRFIVYDDHASVRTIKIVKRVAGPTDSDLYSSTLAIGNGDTIAIEAEGTTLRIYKNVDLITSVTDSAHSSGTPGLIVSYLGFLDNWEAGNVVAGVPVAPGVRAFPRSILNY